MKFSMHFKGHENTKKEGCQLSHILLIQSGVQFKNSFAVY